MLHILNKLDQFLEKTEKLFLLALVVTMIAIAVVQIALRNGFGFGFVWAEPLVRLLVLWCALVGALVASRHNEHIKIDLLLPRLSKQRKKQVSVILHAFTIVICFSMFYTSLDFILMEKQDNTMAVGGIPTWIAASIIPIAFLLMGLRYIAHIFSSISNKS